MSDISIDWLEISNLIDWLIVFFRDIGFDILIDGNIKLSGPID